MSASNQNQNQAQVTITSIQPTGSMQHYATINQRSKEGEEKKTPFYALFDMPQAITQIANDEIRGFAMRAFTNAVWLSSKEAIKSGHMTFPLISLNDCYAETKREFLITKKDLEAWIDGFSLPIISAAISAKSGLHIDNPKVVKKALAYKEILIGLASRSIMSQEDIDNCIRCLELVASANCEGHAYTDNVAQGIERKQNQLNEFLAAGQNESDNELDF